MTSIDFFVLAREHGARTIDLKLSDLLGTWQDGSYPVDTGDEDTLEGGVGINGSWIRAVQPIDVSDMLAMPDPPPRAPGTRRASGSPTSATSPGP